MATIRLLLDKRKKKDGSSSINLVIRINKIRFVFATGISAPVEDSFSEVSLLGKNVPQYKIKNVKLVGIKNAAERLLIDNEHILSSLPAERAKEMIMQQVFGEAPCEDEILH